MTERTEKALESIDEAHDWDRFLYYTADGAVRRPDDAKLANYRNLARAVSLYNGHLPDSERDLFLAAIRSCDPGVISNR